MSNSNLQRLHVLAEQLRDQYRTVEQSVNEVYSQKDTAPTTETLESIRELLLQVKKTEKQIQPIRSSLEAEHATLPKATQTIVDETVQIVTTLIPRIGALEKEAVESKAKLAPVIREGVRAVKMKSAYSKQQP